VTPFSMTQDEGTCPESASTLGFMTTEEHSPIIANHRYRKRSLPNSIKLKRPRGRNVPHEVPLAPAQWSKNAN